MQGKDWVIHCYQGIYPGINRNKERTFCFRIGKKINHRTKERMKTSIVHYGCHWIYIYLSYICHIHKIIGNLKYLQELNRWKTCERTKCLDTISAELIFREWEELMNLYGECEWREQHRMPEEKITTL